MKYLVIPYFLIINLIMINNAFAQCTYYNGEQEYSSTCFQEFKDCEGGPVYYGVKVSISVNNKSGFLITESNSNGSSEAYILGSIYLFLDDGTKITLINRKYFWNLNGKMYHRFVLTSSEMNQLLNSNIKRIYYKECPFEEHCMSQFVNAYTYCNVRTEDYSWGAKIVKERIDWPRLISEIYIP